MRCLPRWLAAAGLGWLGLACRTETEPQSAAQPACDVQFSSWRAADGRHDLVFIPDGTRLVVDGRWSFDPETVEYAPIVACPANGSLCLRAELSFALSDHRFGVVEGDRLAVGVLERELEPFRPIPRWLSAAAEVSNVVAWLDRDRLLIVQSSADGQSEPTCRTLDLGTGVFHTPAGGCPRSAFSQLGRIEPRAPGVWAVHSSAEGASAEQIIRYTPEGGQEDPPLASVTLPGWSAVNAWGAPDGTRMGFLSPCDLSGASAVVCEDPDTSPTRVYEVNPSDGTLRVVRDDLPPGSVRDPQHDRFAWVANDTLCVGDPGGADVRCAPLRASAECR